MDKIPGEILCRAIDNLRPGSEWMVVGDKLEWLDHLVPAPTHEEILIQAEKERIQMKWQELRDKRDKLLADSDWTQNSDAPFDHAAKLAWLKYRQDLRDLPGTVIDPENPRWPVKPT